MLDRLSMLANRYRKCWHAFVVLSVALLTSGTIITGTAAEEQAKYQVFPLANNFGFEKFAPGPRKRSGVNYDLAKRVRMAFIELDRQALEYEQMVASGKQPAEKLQAEGVLKETEARLSSQFGQKVKIRNRPGGQGIRELKIRDGTDLSDSATLADSAAARAASDDFLDKYRGLLRLEHSASELVMKQRKTDDLQRHQFRYGIEFNGVQAWPSEIIVQTDAEGKVDLLSGAYSPYDRRLAHKPAVSRERAIEIAKSEVEKKLHTGPLGTVKRSWQSIKAELIVYTPSEYRPRLAWRVNIEAGVDIRWLVIVDASKGGILTSFNQVAEANVVGSGKDLYNLTRPLNVWKQDSMHYLVDTSKSMFDPTSTPPNPNTTRGAIVVLDARNQGPDGNFTSYYITSMSNDSGWLADGVSAAYGLSQTYEYFRDRHDRNSLDGEGGGLLGFVRVGQQFGNAFYNGTAMYFGDGRPYVRSIDVVAHELSHGVTRHSANLIYQDQSGALNESFSDILGEMVEAYTEGSPDWLKGGPSIDWTIQNYANPNSVDCLANVPCPAKLSEFISTDLDNGGVHLNSSIINHAFYQLAVALPGAIGLHDAEWIFYRSLTTKLGPRSEFIDARLGAISSAEELFGTDSPQALKTAEAFDLVEIFDVPPSRSPMPSTPVSDEDSTLFMYYDSLWHGYRLGRKENALNDSSGGSKLINENRYSFTKQYRLSISGDGELAVFVNSRDDACLVQTDGAAWQCLGLEGKIHSVAVSPDRNQLAFVLLDDFGKPLNTIRYIDTNNEENNRTIELRAPVLDGGTVNVEWADTMQFNLNNDVIVYDALNRRTLPNGDQVNFWSIYSYNITSDRTSVVVWPQASIDVGFPALGYTTGDRMVFEVIDTTANQSTSVVISDLRSGKSNQLAQFNTTGYAVPTFNGDDTQVVFSVPDSTTTGFSLVSWQLAADGISPQGSAKLWLRNGKYGVVYRRGKYMPPQYFSVTLDKVGGTDGLITSSPTGIICGSTCSDQFQSGTQVTLSVGGANDVFAGWSGAKCSGTGNCTFIVSADTQVTAIFEPDSDGDGVIDVDDNCPTVPNSDQADLDNDNQGNVCDTDDDGDGMSDSYEQSNGLDPLNPGDAEEDFDSDGLYNQREAVLGTRADNPDTDGDGTNDGTEVQNNRNPLVNEPSVIQMILNEILSRD